MLVDRLHYRVPVQDLRLPLRRLPPLPHSGFVIDTINLKHGWYMEQSESAPPPHLRPLVVDTITRHGYSVVRILVN
jgi:hypothetical protein